jgi:hypothetical protein
MKAKQQISKLSISVPAELKPRISQRAAQLDLTVSQYIRRLANEEMGPRPIQVERKNVVNTEYE